MLTLLYTIVILMNVLIALYDFAFYRIPNVFVLALLALFVLTAPFAISGAQFMYSLAVFGAVIVLGFALFQFGVIGGGDAKYLAVAAMWVGHEHFILFLMVLSLVGGGMALVYLKFQTVVSHSALAVSKIVTHLEKTHVGLQKVWLLSGAGYVDKARPLYEATKLPYGVAIAAGVTVALYLKIVN